MATSNKTTARPPRRVAASRADTDTGAVVVPIAAGEPILRQARREISILVAREDVTITHARYPAGERIAGPHVHHDHTDAFYVLEGELAEAETITVAAGGLVAAPPGLAHAFRTAGQRPARWLTIHAPDGGFATFMRATRAGRRADWDIAPKPADGGLPAGEATVSHAGRGEQTHAGARLGRLRCALPDLNVTEWQLTEHDQAPPLFQRDRHGVTILLLDGELEATLAGTTRTAGPGTLVALPPGAQSTLHHRGPEPTRFLGLHTPGNRHSRHLTD